MVNPDPDPSGGRPPRDLSPLAVRGVESAAWTATIAFTGLMVAPLLALVASVTHGRWLAHAAPATAKAALATTALAATLTLVAFTLAHMAGETDAST